MMSMPERDIPVQANKAIWGCMHCSIHFNRAHLGCGVDPRRWLTYAQAREHLLEACVYPLSSHGCLAHAWRAGMVWKPRFCIKIFL